MRRPDLSDALYTVKSSIPLRLRVLTVTVDIYHCFRHTGLCSSVVADILFLPASLVGLLYHSPSRCWTIKSYSVNIDTGIARCLDVFKH